MAVTDSDAMGIHHLTVVPENFGDDAEAEAGGVPEREPRVPRHR